MLELRCVQQNQVAKSEVAPDLYTPDNLSL